MSRVPRTARAHASSAATWVARALKAYARAARGDLAAMVEAEEYRGEALEHAALVGDRGKSAARVQRRVDAARDRAWKGVGR